MTTADLIVTLARANLAASGAILLVLALRALSRRLCGAHIAYGLWLLPPAAVAGGLMPGWTDALVAADDAGRTWLDGAGRADGMAVLWAAGLAASIAMALWRQARFDAAARAGRAGPAVVGVIAPRLVAPADFATRFSDGERRLIRAHELAHIDRRDGLSAALATAATWLCWFNPLAYAALGAFRRDQELACDATVMSRLPRARRAYAETLLRSEPAVRDADFACNWRTARHPLAERIEALARRRPSQVSRDMGVASLVLLCAAAFVGTRAAQPPLPAHAFARSSVMQVELSPAGAQETAWVYRWEPRALRSR